MNDKESLNQIFSHIQSAFEEVALKIGMLESRMAKFQADLQLPKYLFHAPLDENKVTTPLDFGEPVYVAGEEFPLPPGKWRMGYAPDDDAHYLAWGKYDHDLIIDLIAKHRGIKRGEAILDFGCSSGRVLRHFHKEHRELDWQLSGVDLQAHVIEWVRRYLPQCFDVFTGTCYPHLPFPDNSLDLIYGISVFSHAKHLWDAWLHEFKRCLRPGGLCIQTVQCEPAWEFYSSHKHEEWIIKSHPPELLDKPKMDVDFLFYGEGMEQSQVFYREDVIRKYWSRYLEVIELLPPPPKHSYQNWIVLRKPMT